MISKSNEYAVIEIAVPIESYDAIISCFRRHDEDEYDRKFTPLDNYSYLGNLLLNDRYDFCTYKGVNKTFVDKLMGLED